MSSLIAIRIRIQLTGASAREFDDVFDVGSVSDCQSTGAIVLYAVGGGSTAHGVLPYPVSKGILLASEHFERPAYDALSELTVAQLDSIQQRDPEATVDSIRGITRRKGGLTVLIFALNVNPRLSPEGIECYSELGFLFQLLEDFNDREVDESMGVRTLIVLEPSLIDAATLIVSQYIKVKCLFTAHYAHERLVKLFDFIDARISNLGIRNIAVSQLVS